MSYDDYLDREISRATDGERRPEPRRQTVAVIDWGRGLLAECAITGPSSAEVDRIDRFEPTTHEPCGTVPPRDWAAAGIDALALADLRALAVETWAGMHENREVDGADRTDRQP